MTRFVATAYAIGAGLNEAAWHQLSWVQADPDPLKLVEFKARADAYQAFLEVGHEDYAKTIDLHSKGPKK